MENMSLKSKIVFLGTPQFAAEALEALYKAGFDIIGVFTQPDKKSGRGQQIAACETKELAQRFNLPIFQPQNGQELDELIIKLNPDLAVVAAYGKIIPERTLERVKYGFLNIHGSLLPRFRGSSCVPSAILHGDKKTGISIMKLVFAMDAGPVLSQKEVEITETDTTASLTKKLAKCGAEEIVRVVPLWLGGKIMPTNQCLDTMTTCSLIRKEDAKIDWTETAEQILRQIRAYYPWPVAFTTFNDKNLRILEASKSEMNLLPGKIIGSNGRVWIGTGQDSIEVIKLQLEGKKSMSAKEFINGFNKDLHGNLILGN